MTDRTRNIIVGATAIVGLIALGIMILLFGEVPRWFESGYPITVTINDANGLTAGSRIRLAGVDIGSIEHVQLMPDPSKGVDLYCHIDARFSIPAGSPALAVAGLLGGSATLQITPAPPPAPPLPRDGNGHLTARASNITQDFQRVAEGLAKDLHLQLANLGKLSEQYTLVGRKLNAMLEERSLADVDAGKVAANITTVITRADAGLKDLRVTIKSINDVLADPAFLKDLRDTAAGASKLTADARVRIDQLTTRYVAVADDLSKTLASANRLIDQARTGKGTLGQLVTNPALYNDLQDAANRLSDALREMKLLLQKWKAEGLPLHF